MFCHVIRTTELSLLLCETKLHTRWLITVENIKFYIFFKNSGTFPRKLRILVIEDKFLGNTPEMLAKIIHVRSEDVTLLEENIRRTYFPCILILCLSTPYYFRCEIMPTSNCTALFSHYKFIYRRSFLCRIANRLSAYTALLTVFLCFLISRRSNYDK